MIRVVVQIGWHKTLREGQKLSAWINGDPIGWEEYPGKWLTPTSKRSHMMWHLCDLDLELGDEIRILCQTGLCGKGSDETRTFEMRWAVASETDEVIEYELPGVGCRGYPVIKGRVTELLNITQEDQRHMDAEEFLEGEF